MKDVDDVNEVRLLVRGFTHLEFFRVKVRFFRSEPILPKINHVLYEPI